MAPNIRRNGVIGDPKRVLWLGSSGGGGATLGHGDPGALRAALERQLGAIGGAGAKIVEALVVVCAAPLDLAGPAERAALWGLGPAAGTEELSCLLRGTLDEVNTRARELDALLAKRVGSVDGVISISADAKPGGVHARSLAAAGISRLPVAGTGGSSLSIAAAELGCVLVGNSGGSVATTAESKAIGIAAALAAAWRLPFVPACASNAGGAGGWRSPIAGCLPVFLSVSCAVSLLRVLGPLLPVHAATRASALGALLSERALAPVLGAVAAHHRSGLGELSVMGGGLIGALCGGSALAALLGASALGAASPRCLAACARASVPATASSLLLGGALPLTIGVVAHAAAPGCARLTAAVRTGLALALGGAHSGGGTSGVGALLLRAASGCCAGLGMSYGSRLGYYHALFLPLIAVEAELGGMALLGALDLLTLCAVGAGACAAQLALPRRATASRDVPLARRGLRINLLCGDLIEACFPFLERDRALDAAVLGTSALVGAMCALAPGGARSMAYLPLPIAIALGDDPVTLARAAFVAFCMPFIVGVASNAVANSMQSVKRE